MCRKSWNVRGYTAPIRLSHHSITAHLVHNTNSVFLRINMKYHCSFTIYYMHRCSLFTIIPWRKWTVTRGSCNPLFGDSHINSGEKNQKLEGILRKKPKACTSSAMIHHQPYRLLLLSSCQLGQPNAWLKCMCGHPRVKWRLWLWQKMNVTQCMT